MKHAMRLRLMGLVAAVPGLLALAGCDSTGHARLHADQGRGPVLARGGIDGLA